MLGATEQGDDPEFKATANISQPHLPNLNGPQSGSRNKTEGWFSLWPLPSPHTLSPHHPASARSRKALRPSSTELLPALTDFHKTLHPNVHQLGNPHHLIPVLCCDGRSLPVTEHSLSCSLYCPAGWYFCVPTLCKALWDFFPAMLRDLSWEVLTAG